MKKVLLIESNKYLKEILNEELKKQKDLNVISYLRLEAEQLQYSPDIVITNANMTLENLMKNVDIIKKHSSNSRIIALSGLKIFNGKEYLQYGIDAFLHKPFSMEKLITEIRK